ncbi:hypothetical protein [Streptomyces radicis]|uniref:Uncharacterized protein n=1 Tax=Streptomyces radicis TaxID=1750517 RepID=A0A3A9WBL0_9ACTN|nr:hypothetical protein [Streptomyces radicis]RKN05016.1 hypothetical protein D7319_26560 [Streptomyces radicis]RKN16363.1 hypothetical protein D7318_26225 [Streptomyces radicis]
MPPVRLPSEAELARDALAAPLFSRAVALARWTTRGTPVGAGGELLANELKGAVSHLGLEDDEDAVAFTADAWNFAVDTGLVELSELRETAEGEGAEDLGSAEDLDDPEGAEDAALGTAAPGPELGPLAAGDPADVLDIWVAGVDAVLEDAATPTFDELLGDLSDLQGVVSPDGEIDPDAIDMDALAWDQEEASSHLDAALGSLYLFAVTDEAGQGASMVPLPMVAAASIVPEDMDELSAEALDELSAAVLTLDGQFRALAGTGMLDYRPVDESLLADDEGEYGSEAGSESGSGAGSASASATGDLFGEGDQDDDITRYGLARLTPLGLYGVRRRMLEAGIEAPVIGELATADAAALLAALPFRPEAAAREEAELWLPGREPLAAARELLAAARGTDPAAPGRRLGCQLVLSLLDGRAEIALREVLDDPELGGLARVWLVERGAGDVPPPGEDMVFWLAIDTLAAQLALGDADESEELRELVSDLAGQHGSFFERAWRTDHPATADVLDAVGRLHPDKALAKQARKAAFKSRSRD